MEKIAKVRMNVTLKAGDDCWPQGRIIETPPPLPPAIISEIRANTGNVEILQYNSEVEEEVKPEESPKKSRLIRRKDG